MMFSATGRLGRDGELKDVGTTKVLAFSIAVDTGYGDKKKTMWVKCAMFGDRAAKVAPYVTQSSLVEVHGEPSIETWIKDGKSFGTIAVRVGELKLHGGNKDRPVADKGRATSRDDMDEDPIPF